MWVPNLAEVEWMTDVLSRHAGTLGISGEVTEVALLDTRLTHPHRPESPLCGGWATCVVKTRDASSAQLYVKGFSVHGAAEAAWREDGATKPGRRGMHLPGPDLLVWRFPDDPNLAALPSLVDPQLVGGILPATVSEALDLQPGDNLRTTVVRYQPEASATLRLEVNRHGAPTVFAKHLPDGEVGAVAARHQALWTAADRTRSLRLAQPLASDPDRGVLWTRGVPGAPLSAGVPPVDLPEVTAPLGALLAALHLSAVDVPERLTVDDLLAEMGKKAKKLVRAWPAVADPVHDLVTAATGRRSDVVRERDCTLHGDFHLDQLVGSPDGPVLVDLDSMVRGAPEIDLAEFLVDLSLRGLPADVAHEVSKRLLTSYAAGTGIAVDVALLTICADAEFVNRCYRHLRRHAPGWKVALETELARRADVAALLQL